MAAITHVAGVLSAGNISHDILLRAVEEFRWGTSTWVEEMVEDMGGNGSNTAYALARLGVPVKVMGMVGRDERGEGLLAKLAGAGVDTAWVQRSEGPTTTTICVANRAGDRLFLQRPGSSLEAFAEPANFTRELCAGVSHYHQANLYSLANLRKHSAETMRRARAAGLTVSVDTGWAADGRWMDVLGPALPNTDLLFVNEDEARMLTGHTEPDAIARTLRDAGATDIALKLGARGCVLYTGGERIECAPFAVEVVDTTGAGDNFAAGFLAALHRGLNYAEAGRVANATGAISVTMLGAGRAARRWDEVRAWIATK
ncbi:MAG: carbohydrate kinase family protein [Bryobacterales bacterium]|nr:carbohydrate kinase family protein [Bryobacterales bacterium]